MNNRQDTPEQTGKDAQFARTASEAATHIYVVQAGSFCKIGITHNMRGRLGQYRVHSPLRVRLDYLQAVPDPRRLEMEVHRHLTAAGKRAHGEWFKISSQAARHLIGTIRADLWPPAVMTKTPEQVHSDYEAILGPRRGPYKLKRRPRRAARPNAL